MHVACKTLILFILMLVLHTLSQGGYSSTGLRHTPCGIYHGTAVSLTLVTFPHTYMCISIRAITLALGSDSHPVATIMAQLADQNMSAFARQRADRRRQQVCVCVFV